MNETRHDSSTPCVSSSPNADSAAVDRRAPLRLPLLDVRVDPPPRGEVPLAWAERCLLVLERALARAFHPRLDPWLEAGAIANALFVVAVVTGVVLLIWYVPSVHGAHASLASLGPSYAPGQLMRSLHRYSSDACLLFVLVHALRLFLARRFVGPRWLAWVTGMAGLGALWVVGWLGYWLVWDEGAKAVALGTARMLDALPIIADPLSRSFLTDAGLNSLVFFVVFFAHMLLPLAMAVALWLHVTRLSRPRLFPSRALWAWVVASLVVVSLVAPAHSAPAARMATWSAEFPIDLVFQWPVLLTERLGAGALWSLVLFGGGAALSLPWVLGRGRARVATVDTSRCNACFHCSLDCPYGAIRMVPRTDGRKFAVQAEVDASKCVGCGVCAGSCDSSGIGLPWLTAPDVRHNVDAFLERAVATSGPTKVAFVCASASGSRLSIDPATATSPSLPGYLVWPVPCSGWVHALTVERAFRHGASEVAIVACAPGAQSCREGAKWAHARLTGAREPGLRTDRVPLDRVRWIELRPTELDSLARHLTAPNGGPTAGRTSPSRVVAGTAGAGFVVALGAATVALSQFSHAPVRPSGAELLVSFKHPGRSGERCHTLSEAEKSALPAHMRRDRVCERGRSAVRLRVEVDGRVALERSLAPRGLFGDAASIALEHVPVAPGTHDVAVFVADESRGPWTFETRERIAFTEGHRRVLLFDRVDGFRVY